MKANGANHWLFCVNSWLGAIGVIGNIRNLVIVACLSSFVSRLSSFVSRLSSLVSRLSSLVFRLSSLVSRLSSFVFRLSSLVSRLSSFVFRLSSFVSRLSSLVSLSSSGTILALFQGKGSGREKVIFFLSLICLHIFLLFSVCTHRPSFFLSLAVPSFKKIVLMSSFCTKLRSPKCSHRLTMLRFRRLASQACPPCGSAKGASALCSRSAASVRTKIISSPPILNCLLLFFKFN